jgi:hypothetical protein
MRPLGGAGLEIATALPAGRVRITASIMPVESPLTRFNYSVYRSRACLSVLVPSPPTAEFEHPRWRTFSGSNIHSGFFGADFLIVNRSLGARLDVVEMMDGLMQGADRDLVIIWQK